MLAISFTMAASAQALPENPYYSRVNSFGVFGAYSNDSSHMLLGNARQRRLLDIGASYDRRLFIDHVVNWQFEAEVLPVALDSDPVQTTASTLTSTNPPSTTTSITSYPTAAACHASSGSGTFPNGGPTYTYVSTCSRRWVIGEGMSPVGFRWSFLPRRRLQPMFTGHGGYMYSTQPIPLSDSGSFNFTFDLGAGLELYRSRSQSLRVEYRYHHISNHDTANDNPGIDNGVVQVTYVFGR